MKVYTKIVYDKDDNIIEEHSYNYNGPVSQARLGMGKKGVSRSSKIEANKYKFQDQEEQARRDVDGTEKRAQGNFSGNTRMSRKGKTPGTVNQANRMKAMDDAGIDATHDTTPIQPVGKGAFHDNMEVANNTMFNTEDHDEPMRNISDPNQLFKFASYNTIFTLSALSRGELVNTRTLLSSQPHDIIIQSGGIGPNANKGAGGYEGLGMGAKNRKILEDNQRMQQTMDKASAEFKKNKDMYFTTVTMNNIPGFNEKRRLTSVTQVNMEVIEPWGITFIERMKAAAGNNDFIDHLDAPYLLTVEFKGWDENGMPVGKEVTQTTKRVIPLKLVNLEMGVTASGTTYQIKGVPYNEFAYVNRYNYPRTSGTIEPKGRNLADIAQELTDVLNKQNTDEVGVLPIEVPDEYEVTIDEFFTPDKIQIDYDSLVKSSMYQKNVEDATGHTGMVHSQEQKSLIGGKIKDGEIHVQRQGGHATAGMYTHVEKLEYMKIDSTDAITKILEEIMKSHPDMTVDKFDTWKEKVAKTLIDTHEKGQNVNARAEAADMYYDYFRIRSSVIPTGVFDTSRNENQKLIKFVISPYKVHAYSLALPGITVGQKMKTFVYKTYNHIFTGENVDILSLDIKYKVAYYTAMLKQVKSEKNSIIIAPTKDKQQAGTTSKDHEPVLRLKGYAGTASSGSTGSTDGGYTSFDQFMDYLTHPAADMVNIRLEILGDPAWLGVSQFIPAVPVKTGNGVSYDQDADFWRGGKDKLWNETYHCYNSDIAEPIINLNFRMPTDINDKEGTYEIAKNKQATFSGLYRVVQVEHNWDNNKYTNVLNLVRFNNQGADISDPEAYATINSPDGSKVTKMTSSDMPGMLGDKGFSFQDILEKARSNVFRKVDKLTKKFHPSQGNVAKQFHPSQGNVKRGTRFNPSQGSGNFRFHPSQGGAYTPNRPVDQTAVNRGVRANEDDI